MAPTPTEIYLPTWHADFKKNNPDRKAPGYYDLALGVKGEGLPSQELNDEYIKHLLREGFKEGGSVDIDAADARLAAAIEKRMAKGGSVDIEAADARLEAAINARMGMAEGGATGFKKIEFMADGGKLVKGVANVGKRLFQDAPLAPKVKPPSDNVANVRQANFQYPKTIGNQTVAIDKLSGGVRMSDPNEVKRVKELADRIASPEGYISRIIVDHNNNVIEGQHRLEALRQLGIADVPVWKIEEMADTMPVDKMEAAVQAVGSIHPDHVGQLVSHALEHISEEGIDKARQINYGRFQKHYNAALDAIPTEDGMADGGKLVKGLSNIGKKLFADSKVLPQAEREANLQKFLSPSAEKRRMYHGSKEPNITEFKTRKDLTNEDNMTGHYADERDAVFLSPDPEFSKDFSVWGYTDEGKAPTTYPVYVQVEKPFDFDNPEHLQKVKATYLDMFHNPESEFYDPHITSSERSMDLHRFNQKVDDLPKDENNWGRIENQQFQDVLKDLGFDSFYTRERGTKNLGIYDPNRIKSAIGNRGTYDLGESDINKAEGGGAFKKLEFMADGGKLIKGLKNIGKKLFADDPLPTTEREANLQKFLEKSKVKEKMYRGATPHFQLEGEPIFVSPTVEFAEKFPVGSASPRIAANQNQTIYPLHVNATNPFDYENTNDIEKIIYEISKSDPEQAEKLKNEFKYYANMGDKFGSQTGNWGLIENTLVQDAIKKLGYDSFYVNEEGVKNLGVYNPNQVKTAIGNRGTYDIEDADITKADGGKIVGGLGKIAKKLMSENTLPTAEREANKAKFLNKSKVVDYNGKPIKMYHHTTNFIGNEFNPKLAQEKDRGYHGQGMYFGSDDYLNRSAFGRHSEGNIYGSEGFIEGSQVMPVYLSIKNPKYVDITDETLHGMPSEELKKQGYDGVIVTRDDSFVNAMGRDVPRKKIYNAVAFEPEQIKSVTGNRGTYDINEPDINKSDGGKIVKGLSKVAKKLLEEPRIQTIEAPSIIIPSKLSNVKEMARKREGEYGARRVERASDEIPNLEKMYQEDALRRAFIGGDNARALMTMNPADFENYAAPLDLKTSIGPKMAEYAKQGDITKDTVPTDEFIKYLRSLQDGFEDIPMLTINKEESGLPLVPFITGHEGRHRSRALAESEQPTSLIQLYPRAELREPFPRRSQEEYIDAIRKEMEMTGNMVRPEVYLHNILQKNVKRDPIKLPDLYADGGAAFKTLQFKDAQHFDGGGIAFPEMTPMTEGSRREPLLTEKDWENIKRNAPEVYEWAKQNVKDEASQLKSARGVKDFALRTGAQYLGGIPDLLNLGLMGVDALADTNLSSEKPWFGSEQYIDAMRKVGMVGENEFPIAETVAGVLMPAGLIKKGIKKISGAKPAKQEPKKRQGGLSAMAR
jgi:hypothetical protein